MSEIADLQREIWECNEVHGFHEDFGPHSMVEKLALVTCEVAEAIEEWRDGRGATEIYYNTGKEGKPEGVPIELADIVIRTLGLAEMYGIDLTAAIALKVEFNWSRPYKHGKVL